MVGLGVSGNFVRQSFVFWYYLAEYVGLKKQIYKLLVAVGGVCYSNELSRSSFCTFFSCPSACVCACDCVHVFFIFSFRFLFLCDKWINYLFFLVDVFLRSKEVLYRGGWTDENTGGGGS